MYLRLDIQPVPASRPRVSKWGTYYGKRHKAFRSAGTACLTAMREQGYLPDPLLDGRLTVVLVLEVKKPKTTKLELPNGDVDNYAKIILDLLTGFVWEDDRQVETLTVRKGWSTGEGVVHVFITEVADD